LSDRRPPVCDKTSSGRRSDPKSGTRDSTKLPPSGLAPPSIPAWPVRQIGPVNSRPDESRPAPPSPGRQPAASVQFSERPGVFGVIGPNSQKVNSFSKEPRRSRPGPIVNAACPLSLWGARRTFRHSHTKTTEPLRLHNLALGYCAPRQGGPGTTPSRTADACFPTAPRSPSNSRTGKFPVHGAAHDRNASRFNRPVFGNCVFPLPFSPPSLLPTFVSAALPERLAAPAGIPVAPRDYGEGPVH